uniref:Conjugal transfer protein TrbK n=1 Tax=Caulobacter sp. (strain K31) TaxID=366602 RepID=B0SV68_CAUSK
MDGKMFARLGAVVFVAVAITATVVEMNRKEEPPLYRSLGQAATASPDPLRDELIRCTMIGEAGTRDPSCLRAWAENRQRFLAPGSRPAERLPTPATQTPRSPQPPAAAIDADPIRKEAMPLAAPQPEAR